MSRKPRLHIPDGFYHTILRGNNRQAIFHTPKDRERWEKYVTAALQKYDGSIHCFCWMTNHVHMLIRVGQQPLSRIVQHAASRFSRESNRLRGNTGHLFERRHRAIPVTNDEQLLSTLRYIHYNPVEAGLVKDPDQYTWSSHLAFLGRRKLDWLSTDFILRLFSNQRTTAIKQYARFMSQPNPIETEEFSDADVGDSQRHNENVTEASARDAVSGNSLLHIATHCCRKHGICLEQLKGPSRARRLVKIRTDIAIEALSSGVSTNAEIARFFNRAEATICEAVRRRLVTT